MKDLFRAARETGTQVRGVICVARHHYRRHRRLPNPWRPRTFNDKVALRMMFDRRPLLVTAADKLEARRYVEQRLGASVLPQLYCSTSCAEDIPLDRLPQRFVIKPSHASGLFQIVRDKDTLDRAALLARCRQWLALNYYRLQREWAYKHLTPRIMVEEYVDDGSGIAPRDYKFFVFDGAVALIQVDVDRAGSHRRAFYDSNWQRLPFHYGSKPAATQECPAPPHLERMCAAAKTLGSKVDFMRADFYDTARQFYFGEITMTPGAGLGLFWPKHYDARLGEAWTMPPLTRILFGRD